MNTPENAWQRLAAAARRAPPDAPATVPFGFATRVAAQALAQPAPAGLSLERLALRAVGVACLAAVLGVAANYSVLANGGAEEERFFTTDDPAAIVLEVS
jgi:hypothetical protein